jgi:C4-dicarboxylate-specific signal transduction histidine kinase
MALSTAAALPAALTALGQATCVDDALLAILDFGAADARVARIRVLLEREGVLRVVAGTGEGMLFKTAAMQRVDHWITETGALDAIEGQRRLRADTARATAVLVSSFSTGLGIAGGVVFEANQPGAFTPEDLDCLGTLTAFAGAVLTTFALEQDLATTAETRAAVEAEFREIEAHTVASQALSRTGSFRWDLVTGEDEWSQETLSLLRAPEGFVPGFESFVTLIHPDDRPRILALAPKQVVAGEIVNLVYRTIGEDGSIRYMQSLARPAREGEYLGAVIDNTERRNKQEAVRQAHSELARMSRLTTMGELAVSITHELNQPLTSIVANAGASLRWLDRDVPDLEKVRESLAEIVSERRRAGDVVASLRAMARKSEPALEPILIDDAIREVVSLTSGEMDRQHISLHLDLDDGGEPILGDKVQLQQVILNLVVNSLDALQSVENRSRSIRIASRPEADRLVIQVADEGHGIDESVRERLFEPFVSTKPAGLGMGLAICRSITDAHDGTLAFAPGSPFGSVFTLSLPRGER